MDYNDFVKIHYIDDYIDLLNIIKGKSKYEDLRKNYIFRGLKKEYYKLIPSSLRKDKYGNFKINKFISDDEFKFRLNLMSNQVKQFDKIWDEFGDLSDDVLVSFIINKNEDMDNVSYPELISSINELQFKREVYVLLKFLNHADKIGLKINVTPDIRRWIHNAVHFGINNFEVWPKPEFYEIISIAQHNNIPTRALDWSYDYNVALYFAVNDILDENNDNCVLWAFNYKLFENHYSSEKFDFLRFITHFHDENFTRLNEQYLEYIPPFEIYRPEYNLNVNLKSQKGLFTFLNSINFKNILSNKPFDEEIVDLLIESHNENGEYELNGFKKFKLDNEIIFHKFIISGNLKKEIFKDLCAEGYNKEFLFPQFDKIAESMEDLIHFEKLLDVSFQKSNVLIPISFTRWHVIKNKTINTIHIINYDNEIIDRVFIQANEMVYGFFYVNSIIKNSVEKLWLKYGSYLNISKHLFLNFLKCDNLGFEIKINRLIKFDYPIPLKKFDDKKEVYFIEGNEKLEFLLNFK